MQSKQQAGGNPIDTSHRGQPNFGERHWHGEPISTTLVESTINQVVSRRKKQQRHCEFVRKFRTRNGRTHFAAGSRSSVRRRKRQPDPDSALLCLVG